MHNIHDKYIKERLQVRQNAIDFLKIAISDPSLYKINWETLTYSPTSYVDDHLKEVFADIVFTCQLEDGTDALCTIIIEHKSYEDQFVAFQLLGYMSRSYLQQIKNKEKLSIVIPLLFCHHSGNYEYKKIESFFDHKFSELLDFVPKYKVMLFNVHDLNDEAIFSVRNVAISTMLLTQKHINNPAKLLNKLSKIYESLQTQEERNFFNSNYVYIMMIAERKSIDRLSIIQKDIDKPLNKYYMTLVG